MCFGLDSKMRQDLWTFPLPYTVEKVNMMSDSANIMPGL